MKTLAEMRPGERAVISDFAPSNDASLMQRIMQMGLIQGTIVELAYEAPFGGAIAVQCRDTLIALRTEDAKFIRVNEIKHE